MIIDESYKPDALEVKEEELKKLLKQYNDKEEKLNVEEVSCKIGWGKDDFIDFNKNREIKRIEWKDILKVNMILLFILVLFCLYDLLTLESQITIPLIQLSVLTGLILILLLVFLIIKRQDALVFVLSKNGIVIANHLYEWDKTNVLFVEKKGHPYLLIKEIEKEEIMISLYFMRQYVSRIVCWTDRYKKHYEKISKREHSH